MRPVEPTSPINFKDEEYELNLVPHIDGNILEDYVTPSVIIEKPIYNNKGELESYSHVDTISIGEKYRIRANITFNMLSIGRDVDNISAKFTLHSIKTTVAEYTENTKTLNVKELTVISPEVIIANNITESLEGTGFIASFDEGSGKIHIHATEDYGMTSGNLAQSFETSFTIDDNMSFYLHIFLKNGSGLDEWFGDGTNITVTFNIGNNKYSYPTDDETGNAGIYLGLKKGSMTKIDTLNDYDCFTASPNENIEVNITGRESGPILVQLEKGHIEFSIIPWSMGD